MHTHTVARACLGIHSGVRDFRREAGTWNMVAVFTSKEQLAEFGTRPASRGPEINSGRCPSVIKTLRKIYDIPNK